MNERDVGIRELLEEFEVALKKYGYSYSKQLDILSRAHSFVLFHERRGEKYLSAEVTADYFKELSDRLYKAEFTSSQCEKLRREAGRFLGFANNGALRMSNPQKGCRQSITPAFAQIADMFLASEDFHPNTHNDMRWVVHKYFAWLHEQGHEDLEGVGAEQIQKFLIDCTRQLSMSSIHNVKLYISKLYACLYEAGLSESSYRKLLSFKLNRESKVYPLLPKEDIAKMLDAIDRNTPKGKRAYAVMMLGTVLGLRACDVIALKLTDINWGRGEIKFVQSKTGNTVVLPLTADVGGALQDYILNVRPKTEASQIFIKMKAPHGPIAAAVTIGEIFRDCCKAAGLPASKRFHSLRRSLATSMVTSGVPVHDVAQGLGDSSIESIKPYIALDSKHLKRCALSFDGIRPLNGGVHHA